MAQHQTNKQTKLEKRETKNIKEKEEEKEKEKKKKQTVFVYN